MANEKLVKLRLSNTEHQLLTKAVVSKARGRKKEYFIRDTELKGFWLRVLPSGTKTYGIHARFNRKGGVFKRTIGSSSKYRPKEAREIAKDWFTKFDAGVDPKGVHGGELTPLELLEKYIQGQDLTARTTSGYRYNFSHYLKHLGKKPIQNITTENIVTWYAAGQQHATGTERTFVTLKTVLDYAYSLDYISENPAKKAALQVKRKANPSKQQHLSNIYDRLPSFMAAFIRVKISVAMRDWMVLSLTTGLRRQESMTLKWDQVDLVKKRITFTTNKSDRFLIVPMVGLTYDMLQSRFEDDTKDETYVFTTRPSTPINDARKALAKICDEAGILKYSHHDFRRLFASVCHELDISEAEIGKLLNHAPKTVTPIYINQSLDKARTKYQRVVDALDRKIPFEDGSEMKLEYFLTATNFMRHSFYGKVDIEPDPPISQEELEEAKYREQEYWEG